jgi:hypothetical protein
MSSWIYTTSSKNVNSNINQCGVASCSSSSPSVSISGIKCILSTSSSWICCASSPRSRWCCYSRCSSKNLELSNRTVSSGSTVTCITLVVTSSTSTSSRFTHSCLVFQLISQWIHVDSCHNFN